MKKLASLAFALALFASAPAVADVFSAPFAGAIAMTVGTAYAPQRGVAVICTGAGNVSVTFTDGSVLIVPVAVGLTTLPYSVTTVNSSGTTATATYYSLK